jgi:ATP-dependent Clp protease ATP-binding subunit ClpC
MLERDPDFGGLPPDVAVRQLIADARSESDRLYHEYIGTEHLVLALAKLSGDAALLPRLKVDPHRVRQLIEDTVRRGRVATAPGTELPFTTRTKEVFALAEESAKAVGHASWGAEHLVVGMLREGRNIGAEVLQRCGLTMTRAAAQVAGPESSDSGAEL